MTIPHNHVAIIGTGFGGIATAVRLQKAGVDDFALIDRAGDVGGVWRDNGYPGAAVDVQSPEAERNAQMAKWGQWFGELGSAVVDGGAATGTAKTVGPGGSVSDGGSRGLTGYSIVSADSLDSAVELANGCPVLEIGGAVDVYEAIAM
jgi:glycine/D-amino acid oxidase-like deaminating enzyme